MGLTWGCKPKQDVSNPFSKVDAKSAPSDYFKTPFQDESQYIVEAVATDLAEMAYFATNHRLPDPKLFSVDAKEETGSKPGLPAYKVTIKLEKGEPMQAKVDLTGPIWSAEVYEALTSALAKQVGLGPSSTAQAGDAGLLQSLTDGLPETVVRGNVNISTALESDFSNPVLHEKAAALLGAFALREHSGHFFDVRAALCRRRALVAGKLFKRRQSNGR